MRRPWPIGGGGLSRQKQTKQHGILNIGRSHVNTDLNESELKNCKERNANLSTVQTGVGTTVRLRTYKWSSEDLDLPFHSRPSHCVYNAV
jgi:hypothetical protein